jgi:hypothetical protein
VTSRSATPEDEAMKIKLTVKTGIKAGIKNMITGGGT